VTLASEAGDETCITTESNTKQYSFLTNKITLVKSELETSQRKGE
jgi:hypothetical protein